MSVIVKDMKMPTGCGSCDFAGFLPDEDPYCRRLMRPIRIVSKRLDGCPLGAIPPHGRLGDLDALSKRIEHERFNHTHTDGLAARHHIAEYGHFLKAIADAPTIIQAEEGEP